MLNKTAYAWTDRNSTTCGKWGRTLFTHYLRKTLHCSAKRSTCPNVQGLTVRLALFLLPHFGWLRPISFIFRFFLFLSRAYSTAACLTHHAECCRDAVREARDIKRGQLLASRYFSCCTGWVKPPVAHYCHTLVTADLKYARNEPLTANKNYLATNRLLN